LLSDLLEILPMVDELTVLEACGATVLAVLENSVSQYPRLEGRFCQVSGVRFAFDPDQEANSRIIPGSVWQCLHIYPVYCFILCALPGWISLDFLRTLDIQLCDEIL